MKKLILACCLSLACLGAHAQTASADVKKEVAAFIDEWHDDAAHARMAYFDKMAADGVYIGTDKTENWKRDEFKAWAKKYFQRPVAWAFKATQRNIYASPDGSFIWFDEILDTQMGPCMASGVIRKTAKGFEILHYQLSMAVPNEVGDKVTALIKAHEAKK
ncbi:MAG TPA: nuclear transport factor 2 family protein [Telluria sp.]|nr:nuclear transport factor 2 family protein [Telluria sp.]